MVIRECVWDVCVYISCTGDEGQLGNAMYLSVIVKPRQGGDPGTLGACCTTGRRIL